MDTKLYVYNENGRWVDSDKLTQNYVKLTDYNELKENYDSLKSNFDVLLSATEVNNENYMITSTLSVSESDQSISSKSIMINNGSINGAENFPSSLTLTSDGNVIISNVNITNSKIILQDN